MGNSTSYELLHVYQTAFPLSSMTFPRGQQAARGLKDPEAVRAKQKRREEAERRAEAAGRGASEGGLKVRTPKAAGEPG